VCRLREGARLGWWLASLPNFAEAGFFAKMKTVQELTDEMNRFVAAMGWYDDDSPCPQTPRNIATSLVLEAAEVLECFQWGEQALGEVLAGELADVALYLLQLAYLTGIDLEQAILDKLALNYERDWAKSRAS
jgi:NTP pyrophosphatase (non-canonical NTP hydrolase)